MNERIKLILYLTWQALFSHLYKLIFALASKPVTICIASTFLAFLTF